VFLLLTNHMFVFCSFVDLEYMKKGVVVLSFSWCYANDLFSSSLYGVTLNGSTICGKCTYCLESHKLICPSNL
jgi:hypothetical protein